MFVIYFTKVKIKQKNLVSSTSRFLTRLLEVRLGFSKSGYLDIDSFFMQSSLKEIIELLQENFPKVKDKSLIKIIFTLKARHQQFKTIGFSRLEATKFQMGEVTLQKIIYFLRDFGLLELTGTIIRTAGVHICNIYKLSDNFIGLFNDLEFYIKKVFEYINPLEFVKRFFFPKFKNGIYSFKVEGQKYLIQTKGKFAGVIYSTIENKIINPLSLL